MISQKKLNELNELLGQELGRNRFMEPLYKWQFSDNYFHKMVLAGKRDFEEVIVRDENGNDSGKKLVVLKRVTAIRKMCPTLDGQWLITRWKWSPESEWRKAFGSDLEYPPRGMYFPVDGTPLRRGLEPDRGINWAFIHAMRKQLNTSLADMERETEMALDREEKASGDLMEDKIGDLTTAFGNPFPGKRCGGISIASKEYKANYDNLRFIEDKNQVSVEQ